MDLNHLCLGCMEYKGNAVICPHCKLVEGSTLDSALNLIPGTILQDKYLIGRALGQGGFGITYLAWDINLNLKRAIKEYMPLDLAYRTAGQQEVSAYKKSYADNFNYGLGKYLEEAQALAKLNENPNTVTVHDFFKANGTAYMVMDFIDGATLKSYLESLEAPLTFEEALNIFMPVIDALKEVHNIGILHRDISPDNILISKRGRIVLIDFGAARQAISDRSMSLSVVMKAGYTPEEQYHSRGVQGPWTDVYALAASMYRAITGVVPLEALSRLSEDTILPPSELGADIGSASEKILLKALSVRAKERYQSVENFQDALMGEKDPITDINQSAGADNNNKEEANTDKVDTPKEHTYDLPGNEKDFQNKKEKEPHPLGAGIGISSNFDGVINNYFGGSDYKSSGAWEKGKEEPKEELPANQGSQNIFDKAIQSPKIKIIGAVAASLLIVIAIIYGCLPEPDVTAINLNYTTLKVEAGGEKIALEVILEPSNARQPELNWSSSASEVATVNTQGLISAIEKGTAIIKVEDINSNISAECRVTVVYETANMQYTVSITSPNETDDDYIEEGSYNGEIKNGLPHGAGEWLGEDDSTYEGDWLDGQWHGKGTRTWEDGTIYEAEYIDGLRNGKGLAVFSNGDTYEGEFKDGIYHGQGTYTFSDGAIYVGEFKDNLRHGHGIMTDPDGFQYDGEWKKDLPNGQGTAIFPDGDKYVGKQKDAIFHGEGTYTYVDGTVWSGMWDNGEFIGDRTNSNISNHSRQESIIWEIRGVKGDYKGELANGIPNGQGTWTANGYKYVGQWLNGYRHGIGEMVGPDGRSYLGSWEHDMKHGRGTMRYPDRTVQSGYWANDKYVGP